MTLDQVAIIGAGRVGLTLARALTHSGTVVKVFGREAPTLDPSGLVLMAVPDDAIEDVARALVRAGAITSRHVILHTSGLRDRTALAELESSGAALGSWHPLQTFATPTEGSDLFVGIPAVIEGDSRALAVGRALAERLQLQPIVEIPAAGKSAYHAAAVFASNYLVVLAETARRLGIDAGAGAASAEMFLPLMRQTLSNYAIGGAASLTGPIRRGDAGTVARHLAVLTGDDRLLYLALGRAALQLAREAGLEPAKAEAIERLLTGK